MILGGGEAGSPLLQRWGAQGDGLHEPRAPLALARPRAGADPTGSGRRGSARARVCIRVCVCVWFGGPLVFPSPSQLAWGGGCWEKLGPALMGILLGGSLHPMPGQGAGGSPSVSLCPSLPPQGAGGWAGEGGTRLAPRGAAEPSSVRVSVGLSALLPAPSSSRRFVLLFFPLSSCLSEL